MRSCAFVCFGIGSGPASKSTGITTEQISSVLERTLYAHHPYKYRHTHTYRHAYIHTCVTYIYIYYIYIIYIILQHTHTCTYMLTCTRAKMQTCTYTHTRTQHEQPACAMDNQLAQSTCAQSMFRAFKEKIGMGRRGGAA
jgi:hypothetical protein